VGDSDNSLSKRRRAAFSSTRTYAAARREEHRFSLRRKKKENVLFRNETEERKGGEVSVRACRRRGKKRGELEEEERGRIRARFPDLHLSSWEKESCSRPVNRGRKDCLILGKRKGKNENRSREGRDFVLFPGEEGGGTLAIIEEDRSPLPREGRIPLVGDALKGKGIASILARSEWEKKGDSVRAP